MKILVVGSGGREHALCWKLSQSGKVRKIFCAPGNAGTATVAENVPLAPTDIAGLRDFAEERAIDLTVVGPEKPLIAGIVDAFEAKGLRIFGPAKEPALIEGSKAYAKKIMQQAKIPTAAFTVFEDADQARAFLKEQPYPLVVKADGEAAGKGVIIAPDFETASHAVHQIMEQRVFGQSGERVVIEEFLAGPEASVMAFCDGDTVVPMIAIQDHKRIGDNDTGPNTGGMGAYAPVPMLSRADHEMIVERILKPAVEAIRDTGLPYRGVLYAGVVLTDDGPKCLEFNCRFGDPETQVALPLLKTDLADILNACVDVELEKITVEFSRRAGVSVVLASGGYPGEYETGKVITGLDAAAELDAVAVFHAGTKTAPSGQIVTDGGRVLAVTATGETFAEARQRSYAAVKRIQFDGAQHRSDIGFQAMTESENTQMSDG